MTFELSPILIYRTSAFLKIGNLKVLGIKELCLRVLTQIERETVEVNPQ